MHHLDGITKPKRLSLGEEADGGPPGRLKPPLHPWYCGNVIWTTRTSWGRWRVKARRGEGQSSPRYHHLSPPLSYRLWPADVANGRASPCHSKSHSCPLRLALPALTERGSEAEGGKRERADRGIFFQRGFLSISVRLSKQETVARIWAGEGAGVESQCGKSDGASG